LSFQRARFVPCPVPLDSEKTDFSAANLFGLLKFNVSKTETYQNSQQRRVNAKQYQFYNQRKSTVAHLDDGVQLLTQKRVAKKRLVPEIKAGNTMDNCRTFGKRIERLVIIHGQSCWFVSIRIPQTLWFR